MYLAGAVIQGAHPLATSPGSHVNVDTSHRIERVDYTLDEFHRNTPDQAYLTDLKEIAAHLHKTTVTRAEYDNLGRFHSSTIVRRFGSWAEAQKLAELDESRTPMYLTEEQLFENLEDVWTRLGRQPRYMEMAKPLSKYSVGTYEKRFGSWRAALIQFVDSMNHSETDLIEVTAALSSKIQMPTRHLTSRTINWRLRYVVLRRDGFKCVACGRTPAIDSGVILQPDHIKPWAKGGETTLENLQTLCSVCNIGKSDLY